MDLWGWDGAIVVGGTFHKLTIFLREYIQEAPLVIGQPPPIGYCHLVPAKPWVMWVESLKDPTIVAHEALHITCGVLDSRGVRLVMESEEAFTYTMQHVMRMAYEKKGWKRV